LHQEITAVKPRESNFILISKIIEAEHPEKRTAIVGLGDCNTDSVLKRIIVLQSCSVDWNFTVVPVYT
jgi:hypothetical protein